MSNNGVEATSSKGKQIIQHAAAQDHCVLDFHRNGEDELIVAEITEHHEALEEMVNND